MLGSLFDRPRNAIQSTPWGDWSGSSSAVWSGSTVTPKTSTQLLTVYGCVRYIAEGIATLPVDVYREVNGAPVEMPKPRWLTQPTPDLDFVAWAGQFLSSLLLAGNFYGLKVYRDGILDQIIPLDPTTVVVHRDRRRKGYRVNGEEVDPFNILHVPGIMWPGSDTGMGPVEAARQSIGLGMAAQEYGGRFFDQDSTPSGVIEVPGELEPVKAREMARSWAKKHAGKGKVGLPGVLQGGAVWKPTAVNNEQAQFLETRRFTAAEIAAQMFLIDPPEIGIGVEGQSLTYTNQEQRNTRKVQVTFLPWIIRLENALTDLLPQPRYLKLNVNGLLRGDTKARFDAYAIGISSKFLVPNEARAFEEMPPLPDGDVVVAAPPPPIVEPSVRVVERDVHGRVERIVG